MLNKLNDNLIVAIDIGTSKIVVLIASMLPDQKLNIIGYGTCPSRGMKRGVIVNLDAVVQSIARAIEEAELMAGCQIHTAYTGIAGNHIKSFNSHGVVAIKDREVTQLDVDQVIEAAKAVAIPADQKLLHVLPQEFIIDHQGGVNDPIGMTGVRLEADVHIVTGAISAAQNIINCVRRCNIDVDAIVLDQLTASLSVLTEDEKELGVCVIDIGAGTTDFAVYVNGAIKHTGVLPIAGDQITNDIAVALRTPTQSAEHIKLEHACAYKEYADPEYVIEVPRIGVNASITIDQVNLADIVEPRYEEIFKLIQIELTRMGLTNILSSGVVITGGSAKMPGALMLAEKIFNVPVRLGSPLNINDFNETLLEPGFACSTGLLLHALKHRIYVKKDKIIETQGFFGKVKNWVKENF